MRLAFAVALPSQLLLLVKPILAQTARGVLVPVGAHVKVDTESGGQSVEGTIVAWRGDTLLVQPQSRTDTVRVASGAGTVDRCPSAPRAAGCPRPGSTPPSSFSAAPRTAPRP